jgi:hypothetical protein
MIDLNTVRFGTGAHAADAAPTGDRDMCIMEAVAFVAGESWSDAPTCASPVISTFLRTWQDALSDADRDRLLPAAVWVPRLVGSRGTPEVEERRGSLALDWLVRVYTLAWLDLVPSLQPHTAALRALPEIVDSTTAASAGSVVYVARAAARDAARDAAGAAARAAARDAARDAAGAAARDAARDAAGAAAWAAAWDAARDAAGAAARDAARAAARDAARDAAWAAAGAAARDAAWDAARDAAWAAAWDAARDAATTSLRPTAETLQQSALDLLDRMLACGEHREEKL